MVRDGNRPPMVAFHSEGQVPSPFQGEGQGEGEA